MQKKGVEESNSLYGLDIDILKSLQLDNLLEESKQKKKEQTATTQ